MWWIIALAVLLVISGIVFLITVQRGVMALFRPRRHPRPGQIRIACTGDSITYGYGIRNWLRNNYPEQLQQLLGSSYCVRNFGVCGATASSSGDNPYEKTAASRDSLAFRPNIVLLMLGTNDSKPCNWKDADEYAEDLKKFVSIYRALPDKPCIILLTPPPAYGDPVPFDIDADVLKTKVRYQILALAGTEQLPCVDLYAMFEGRPELLWDGVHPNAAGAECIAKAAAAYVRKEKEE
ncbi:MAG: hypothetical protein IJU49_05330 [Lachnospiraceae bacterium]|nr:hypothetical protein [Lachnospiraceae bacterium]